MNELKVYTLEEANRLLPELREMIKVLQSQRDLILAKEAEIDVLELITEKKEGQENPAMAANMQEYNRQLGFFYQNLDQMTQKGCHLKNLDTGLVDFYYMYEGKLVYLCWKLDEESIGHWHEIGQGFDTRQPLKFGK